HPAHPGRDALLLPDGGTGDDRRGPHDPAGPHHLAGHRGGHRRTAVGAARRARAGAGILLAVWGAWYLIRREEGMGLGDVKMLAMIGAFLGWHGVLVTLFCGALAGSVVGLALMRWGSHDMRSKLPFGTFLALGGLIALFAGEALIASYVTLL